MLRFRNCFLGIIICFFVFGACDKRDGTWVIIEGCLDQDERPLGESVVINVAGQTKIWTAGTTCQFRIDLNSTRETVVVTGDAGELYSYVSPDQYNLELNQTLPLILHFFRPYKLRVSATNRENNPVPGVRVVMEGTIIGLTNETGVCAWEVKNRAMMPGDRLQIELSKDNFQETNLGVILMPGKFNYTLAANLISTNGEFGGAVTTGEFVGEKERSREGADAKDSTEPSPYYTLRIRAKDAVGNGRVAGVDVKLDKNIIGKTDSRGFLSYRITKTSAGMQTEAKKVSFSKSGYNAVRITPSDKVEFKPNQSDYDVTAYFEILSVVFISSEPSGALFTLTGTGKRKKKYTGKTPDRISVVPDFYEWEVKLNGYLAVKSQSQVDLLTQNNLEIPLDLEPIRSEGDPLILAEEAFNKGAIDSAINFYEAVEAPSGRNARPERYADAQNRLGEIYLNEKKDYRKAVNAFKNAIKISPRDYAIHYNLATAYYTIQDYQKTRDELTEVIKLQPLILPDEFETVELDVLYLKAISQFSVYQNELDTRAKRQFALKALSALSRFSSRVPVGASSDVLKKRRDAQEKINVLKREMDSMGSQ